MKSLVPLVVWLALPFTVLSADKAPSDCRTSQDYLSAAQQLSQAGDSDQAADLAREAVDVCPSYDGFELLAESQTMASDRSDRAKAATAFVSAYELAPSESARAHTLYEYAQLLYGDGDPQNAYPLVKEASVLDPQSAEISALGSKIRERIDNPSRDQIVRGLWDSMYKPVHPATNLRPLAEKGSETSKLSSGTLAISVQAPSVNIPINFEVGTTMVDEKTSSNIAILAEGLADPSRLQAHFTFVGHADVRGVEANNVVLSKRRAESIYQAVVLMQPTLRGRIEVVGRGSSEPIDPRSTEEAYRANRRLQVLLK